MDDKSNDDMAVERLLQYISIDTVQPCPKYNDVVKFMEEYASEIPVLDFFSDKLPSGFPYVVLTWNSQNTLLPGILLNSHMDVVPFDVGKWTKGKPFGLRSSDGMIYGRGTQDMKSIAIIQIEAIRRLSQSGFIPKRNVYILLIPDEEVGGHLGMNQLVKSKFFTDHKIALALDEACPSPTNEYLIAIDERYPYWIDFQFTGRTGHGSLPNCPEFSSERFRTVFNMLYDLHKQNVIDINTPLDLLQLGNIITANLTKMSGGIQTNIIPSELNATFDIRVPPKMIDTFVEVLDAISSMDGVEIHYQTRPIISKVVESEAIQWATDITDIFKKMDLKCLTMTMPGTTDMRYIRELGIPAIGLSPFNNTPIAIHDHDEFISEDVFCFGIKIYTELLKSLLS
ncbi:hypothetical protein GJ496_011206 [Pomphorhynchus laevis]|nr:hypothetical protein GJ496_011206 [Pomphorhynchus laevis]